MTMPAPSAKDSDRVKKTFVLGVGAQKAGTSWLHRYINACGDANMGFQKEYHIWDAVYSELCRSRRISSDQIHDLDSPAFMRYCMQTIDGFYEAYFASIWNRGFSITGDITPSYAGLTADQFSAIRERIRAMNVDVKVVFLMRDPVERCWSAARMKQRLNPHASEDSLRHLERHFESPGFQFRTRYEITCLNLYEAFPPEEVYVGFYETMFEDGELARLSRFLGIPINREMKDVRVNSSPKTSEIPDRLRRRIRLFYQNTYRYCHEHFPQTRELWALT